MPWWYGQRGALPCPVRRSRAAPSRGAAWASRSARRGRGVPRSRDLRWRPSMISIRLPLRAAKSRLALPTQEVVTSTPLAAFLSSITPASACTASTPTILLYRLAWMMHSPPTIGSSLTATASTPSSAQSLGLPGLHAHRLEQLAGQVLELPGERASRSGRLSRPAMTSISSTNSYFDRSNFRTGSTGYQVPGVRGDQRVEVAAQARLGVQLRFVQDDLGEGVPHGLDAEQQRPDRLAGGAVLGRDVAVEHDPADQRGRGDVERLGQRAQRHPADQLLIQLVDLRWLARLGLDEGPWSSRTDSR